MSEDYANGNCKQNLYLQYFFPLGGGDRAHWWHARKAGSGPRHVGAAGFGANSA